MKFVASVEPFRAAVNSVVPILKRTPITILEFVILTAKDGEVEIGGTDMDASIRSCCAVDISTEGALCVSGLLLSGALGGMSGSVEVGTIIPPGHMQNE